MEDKTGGVAVISTGRDETAGTDAAVLSTGFFAPVNISTTVARLLTGGAVILTGGVVIAWAIGVSMEEEMLVETGIVSTCGVPVAVNAEVEDEVAATAEVIATVGVAGTVEVAETNGISAPEEVP